MENLLDFKELGIAGISIGALAFICYKLIAELKDSRLNYESFVKDNNHTTTELVKEATATMVETKNAIAQHNELLKVMIEKVK